MLVVATYRSDELHRRHPLRPLLAELARDPLAHLVELAALTRDEMAEQLEDILGSRADPGLVERLYSRSEGNPLFTEELLAVGLDGRGALPPTLRDALMLRVERLSPAAQEVLRWLACQSLDDDLLAELTGLEPRAPARRAARGGRRATSRSPAPTAATASATRCCARWSTTTCCPASAPSCTPPWRARSSSARARGRARAPDRRGRPTTGSRPATSPPRSRPRCAPPPPPSA